MVDPRELMLLIFKAQGYELTADLETRLDYLLAYASAGTSAVDIEPILRWLEDHRRHCGMTLKEIPMSQVDRWSVDPISGAIAHDTGEFFRVIGIRVENATIRESASWCQPMIHQREMGILGILVQRRNGVDHYLLQAKAEPGNVDRVQLSPTLQSTISNLKRAHGGSKSRFADLFENTQPGAVIYSKHQVEDGGRFYLKTNLNMLVRLPESAPLLVPPDFIWVTLAEIKALLHRENVVNVAVRSIISPLW